MDPARGSGRVFVAVAVAVVVVPSALKVTVTLIVIVFGFMDASFLVYSMNRFPLYGDPVNLALWYPSSLVLRGASPDGGLVMITGS